MTATHTGERIRKLLEKGLSPDTVARKIGRPGDIARVERVRRGMGPRMDVPTLRPSDEAEVLVSALGAGAPEGIEYRRDSVGFAEYSRVCYYEDAHFMGYV